MTQTSRAKALSHPDPSRPAPAMSLPTQPGGRPTKTERPQRFPQREQHPITIMSPTNRSSTKAADRLGGNRACIAIARKLLLRSYHTLRELGEEALQPV